MCAASNVLGSNDVSKRMVLNACKSWHDASCMSCYDESGPKKMQELEKRKKIERKRMEEQSEDGRRKRKRKTSRREGGGCFGRFTNQRMGNICVL